MLGIIRRIGVLWVGNGRRCTSAYDWIGGSAPGLSSAPVAKSLGPLPATRVQVAPKVRLSSAKNELDVIGLNRGNDPDTVAAMFVRWLHARSPSGIWVSAELAELAWHDFANETGAVVPHPRTLLSAIKRGRQMHFRANCRITLRNGEFARKATTYGFQPLPGSLSVVELSDSSIGF